MTEKSIWAIAGVNLILSPCHTKLIKFSSVCKHIPSRYRLISVLLTQKPIYWLVSHISSLSNFKAVPHNLACEVVFKDVLI